MNGSIDGEPYEDILHDGEDEDLEYPLIALSHGGCGRVMWRVWYFSLGAHEEAIVLGCNEDKKTAILNSIKELADMKTRLEILHAREFYASNKTDTKEQ